MIELGWTLLKVLVWAYGYVFTSMGVILAADCIEGWMHKAFRPATGRETPTIVGVGFDSSTGDPASSNNDSRRHDS